MTPRDQRMVIARDRTAGLSGDDGKGAHAQAVAVVGTFAGESAIGEQQLTGNVRVRHHDRGIVGGRAPLDAGKIPDATVGAGNADALPRLRGARRGRVRPARTLEEEVERRP